jgi:adenine-specific DNA-methyltransferase
MVGVGYLGCKTRMLPYLDHVLTPLLSETSAFGDLFAGTGTVGAYVSRRYRVRTLVACDYELYSYVLNKALHQCPYTKRLDRIIGWLNAAMARPQTAVGLSGLVQRFFSPHATCQRMFFTTQNARRIDAVRVAILLLYRMRKIRYREYVFLLGSLLASTSKVANTAGTFRAYLKHFSERARKPFVLIPLHCVPPEAMAGTTTTRRNRKVVKADTSELIQRMLQPRRGEVGRSEQRRVPPRFDVLYLDPPYNASHYGGYYSFLNYLCLYHPQAAIQGVGGILRHYHKSAFGFSASARRHLHQLLHAAASLTKHIVLSYSSDGVLSKKELVQMSMPLGRVVLYKVWITRYKSHKRIRERLLQEYIVHIDCTQPSSYAEVELAAYNGRACKERHDASSFNIQARSAAVNQAAS